METPADDFARIESRWFIFLPVLESTLRDSMPGHSFRIPEEEGPIGSPFLFAAVKPHGSQRETPTELPSHLLASRLCALAGGLAYLQKSVTTRKQIVRKWVFCSYLAQASPFHPALAWLEEAIESLLRGWKW